MPITLKQRMDAISEQGLCTGCGICQAVVGKSKIRVEKATNGYERPIVVEDLTETEVDDIYEVCPGVRVSGLPETQISADSKLDLVWGYWRGIHHAWAGDPDVRHIGSTGGVLSALAQFLLDDGRVSFILHARASTENPGFGEEHVSTSADEVIAGAGSRYGPAAILKNIDHHLDRAEPFAFVGKPCDVAALRNYAKVDKRVNDLLEYYLTPVCGGYMPPFGLSQFFEREGIDESRVTSLRYRGFGCPGPTRVETDAEVREFHYLDLWGEDESQWHLPFRCKVCPDGIGESADIAAADTWPGGSPNRIDSETDLGTNAIIARTAKGEELIQSAAKAGALVLGRAATINDMNKYQPHQVNKKQVVFDRFQGLLDEGRLAPKTAGLRLEELAETCSQSMRKAQRAGTRERVRIGKASEPNPTFALKNKR